MGNINKTDGHARDCWGASYDAIPKSVFATVAWHLANLASGNADNPGAAESAALAEVETLTRGGHIPERQGRAAAKAIRKTFGGEIDEYREEFGEGEE